MEIRQATIKDSKFVALGIAMALHLLPDEETLQHIEKICQREDVLYSFRNAIIAFVDNKPVGLGLGYNGKGYHEIKEYTFSFFEENSEEMDFEHFDDETCEGEYYIDSVAVLEEYRCKGIGSEILRALIKKGSEMELPLATLLVDPENSDAQKLYTKLGFKYMKDLYCFGQTFWKMRLYL